MEARHQVDDQQAHEAEVRDAAPRALSGQQVGIDALEDQRAVEHGQAQQAHAGDDADQQQGVVIKRQHRSEQDVQQVDLVAVGGDDDHAQRQGHQIEGRQAAVLGLPAAACHQRGGCRHQQAADDAAQGHGGQRQAGDEVGDGCARQDGVRHGVAGEAHATQHEEDPHRCSAQRQGQTAGQGAAHEAEFDEGADEPVPQLRHVAWRCPPLGERPMRRPGWRWAPRTSVYWAGGPPPNDRRHAASSLA